MSNSEEKRCNLMRNNYDTIFANLRLDMEIRIPFYETINEVKHCAICTFTSDPNDDPRDPVCWRQLQPLLKTCGNSLFSLIFCKTESDRNRFMSTSA